MDTDESKLANQIARLLAIVPAHHTQPSNRSLLLYDKSGEAGFQCDLCNGGFHVICIPDSLLQIYKGKRVYKNALLCQTNLNDARSAPFVSQNEETKCLCFYFDTEWRSSLVIVFFVVMLSPGRFLHGGSKTQVTGYCFTNTGTALNLN